jgi:Tfp pilus assembly protein PilX
MIGVRRRRRSVGHEHTAGGSDRDRGSALLFALMFVTLASLIVVPMLGYAVTVGRSSRIATAKSNRAEAVKGALRVALADPAAFYDTCSESGLTISKPLASANLNIGVSTSCTTTKNTTENVDSDLRLAMATTQVGTSPPAGTVGTAYPGSGGLDPAAWLNDMTTTSTGGKIFLPYLPSHALSHPSPSGYAMPAWVGSCRVYFPGTYSDPIVISDATPVYFTSGVYYFEDTLTFSGSANVVIGGGAAEGCTNDQEAAFEAINAPKSHNITGYGATFVLGAAGRLLVNDATGGSGVNVQFNTRLVDSTDVATAASKGVSIVSVNGVMNATVFEDLNLVNQLFVPKSEVQIGTSVTTATDQSYAPSTMVPSVFPAPQTDAIIDVAFTGSNANTLYIPGYVSVPQGRVNISVAAGMEAGKSVSMLGGVLAALFTQSATPPATQQLGIINRVVQKTFKVVSVTTSGLPRVTSTALVQVNDYGEYVINSWEVQSG